MTLRGNIGQEINEQPTEAVVRPHRHGIRLSRHRLALGVGQDDARIPGDRPLGERHPDPDRPLLASDRRAILNPDRQRNRATLNLARLDLRQRRDKRSLLPGLASPLQNLGVPVPDQRLRESLIAVHRLPRVVFIDFDGKDVPAVRQAAQPDLASFVHQLLSVRAQAERRLLLDLHLPLLIRGRYPVGQILGALGAGEQLGVVPGPQPQLVQPDGAAVRVIDLDRLLHRHRYLVKAVWSQHRIREAPWP